MSQYGDDASITGSLTVDGEIILGHGGDDDVDIDSHTLFVDASTNRVGIGTDSPSATLEVSGTLKITGADEPALLMLDDQDASAQIGRAHVGYVGSSDFAAFAHQDRATATEYALAHRSTGQTDINTAAGTNLTLRYASAIRAQLDTNGYFSIGSNYAPGTHKLAVDGDALIEGNLTVNEYIYHNGDTNTYLRFQDDDINLNCGGKSMVKMSEQPSAQDVVTINNGGSDVDFRVKDSNGNISFHVDGEFGSVGVGGDASLNALTVVEDRHADVAASFFNDGDEQYRYGISIRCGTDDGTASRAVRFYDGDGDEVGYISWSGGNITYATFTGGHEAAVESGNYSAGQDAYQYGTLVKVISTSAGNRTKQVNYVIGATTSAKDKTVFGVYSCNLDPEEVIGQNTGHQVFAVGDGHVLVCSEGGDIEAGDYICSSNTSGHGMKQDDDLLHNYTVAKATEAVNWASEGQSTKLISCTYHAA